MNDLLQRRRILQYFGLGAIGTGGALLAARLGSKEMLIPETSASTSVASDAIAAKSSGKRLPEFQGIAQWLNSEPLTVQSLKGKVVLIQFWTFACINCQRTLPYITRWHQQYAPKGLQVIGIHTPEFAYERDVNTVKRALRQHGITYPVPLDNEFKTWNAYSNQYWPHLFLADRMGAMQYDHIGEGAYDQTEQMIRRLLG